MSVAAAKHAWKLKKRQDILLLHGSDLKSSINDILVQTLKTAPKHAQTVSVIGISLSSRVTWANLPLKDSTDEGAFFLFSFWHI